jgi:stringent starvation protein B
VTSHRPYLLRAMYQWVLDNGSTPYIIVSTTLPGVSVPAGHAENGRIVLNIGPMSIRNLEISNEKISFDGRFSGHSFRVSAPIGAVMAVYAKESGEGMAFEAERAADAEQPTPREPSPGGHLRVVK